MSYIEIIYICVIAVLTGLNIVSYFGVIPKSKVASLKSIITELIDIMEFSSMSNSEYHFIAKKLDKSLAQKILDEELDI